MGFTLPRKVSMKCPLCQKSLEIQGMAETADHYVFNGYCHKCIAQVRIDVRKAAPAVEKKEEE
jgi:hypothetical protein